MAKNNQGYIVIYSIIIVSAIVTAIIFSTSWISLVSVKTSHILADSKQGKALANACAETALQNIRNDINFNSSGNLTTNRNNCSYTVFNQGGTNRLIEVESSVFGSVSKIKILTDQINPKINITSWQEVADF